MGRIKRYLAAFALTAMVLPMAAQAAEVGKSTIIATMELNMEPAQMAESDFVRGLTTDKLYRLSSDGAELSPSLAAEMPVDVTSEYAGNTRYGVPANAVRGYAFRIALNEAACWDDGTPITADDYIYSAEKQLEALTLLANVDAYFAGKERRTENIVSLRNAGFASVAAAKDAGITEFYVDTDGFWGLDGGWRHVSDGVRLRDYAMPAGLSEMYVTAAYLYRDYLAGSEFESEFVGISAELSDIYTLADVGIVKTGAHEITLILAQPATATALALELEDFKLLREGFSGGYGPYRIVSADGAGVVLEPNPYWHGEAPAYDRVVCG